MDNSLANRLRCLKATIYLELFGMTLPVVQMRAPWATAVVRNRNSYQSPPEKRTTAFRLMGISSVLGGYAALGLDQVRG